MRSPGSNCKASSWYGDPIKLFHNDEEKAIIPSKFTDFEYCIDMDDVDIENDEFKMLASGSDGVCIDSLHINNNQILVGKNNDLAFFEFVSDDEHCSNDYMSSSQITIQNGQVISSTCKGQL